MTTLVFSNLGLINIVIVALTGLSCSSPIKSAETHHRTLVGMDAIDNPLHSAQDFLSHFLSTLNLTRLRSQPRMPTTQKEPLPEYMLELYNRFANDRTAVPSASIVRSFKNEGTDFFEKLYLIHCKKTILGELSAIMFVKDLLCSTFIDRYQRKVL